MGRAAAAFTQSDAPNGFSPARSSGAITRYASVRHRAKQANGQTALAVHELMFSRCRA